MSDFSFSASFFSSNSYACKKMTLLQHCFTIKMHEFILLKYRCKLRNTPFSVNPKHFTTLLPSTRLLLSSSSTLRPVHIVTWQQNNALKYAIVHILGKFTINTKNIVCIILKRWTTKKYTFSTRENLRWSLPYYSTSNHRTNEFLDLIMYYKNYQKPLDILHEYNHRID